MHNFISVFNHFIGVRGFDFIIIKDGIITTKKLKFLTNGMILLIFSITFSGGMVQSSLKAETPYFPTNGWRQSTPEDQGMNSTKLNSMYDLIIEQELGIDSMTIIRNGYLVYEEYFNYYNFSNIHQMFSVTKSVIGLLIGIAKATGFIPNLDQPVLEIFANRTFSNVDAKKQAITIRHLLKMQSGIQWNQGSLAHYNDTIDIFDYDLFTNHTADISNWPLSWPYNHENDWVQMYLSLDYVQFVLDKPMEHTPGTNFLYSNGDSLLLSAIIQNKTGMTSEEFALQYLFGPLNITEYVWWKSPLGITMGGTGLWLRPLDMVKIGYLCLNNGLWNSTQIVPEAWIEESFQDHSNTLGYGYQWWIEDELNYILAWGLGGQHIMVKPSASLVVVTTSSNYHSFPTPTYSPLKLIESFILKSLVNPISESTTTESKASFLNLPFVLVGLGIMIFYKVKKRKKWIY